MKNYKASTASNRQELHYSVGAIVEHDGKYLLVDRVNPPFGFAGYEDFMEVTDVAEKIVMNLEKDNPEVELIIKRPTA